MPVIPDGSLPRSYSYNFVGLRLAVTGKCDYERVSYGI